MTTHHTIDWIHKYRKYKSKYFELKQRMGLYNQSGGQQPKVEIDAKKELPEIKLAEAVDMNNAKGDETVTKNKVVDTKTKETDESIKNLITIKAMNGAQPTCGKISPGGLFILVGYNTGQCCIYQMSTGEMILNEPFQTECSKINDVDWAEGSMLFVVGGDIDESYEPSQTSTLICRMLYNGNESIEEDLDKDGEFTNIEIVSVKLDTQSKSIEYIQWENNLIFAGYNDNDKFKILLFKDDVKTEYNDEQLELNDEQLEVNDEQLEVNDGKLESFESMEFDNDEFLELDNPKQKGGMPPLKKEMDENLELNEIEFIEEDNDMDINDNPKRNNVMPVSANGNEFKLIPFEEHSFTVKGKGMSFNADKSKLSIIVDDAANTTIITISANVSGSPILEDKEYITNSKIKPKKITSNSDKILLLGEGIEEIDITEPMDDTKSIEPLTIILPDDMKLPILCSYNPVTTNELLVCSQDKLCIYDTTTKSCIKTIDHKLTPTINDVDWRSSVTSEERFFITITDTDIRVWCMDCDSGKQNRHITCDDSTSCADDGEGKDDDDSTEGDAKSTDSADSIDSVDSAEK
jgi:hypothetical protein